MADRYISEKLLIENIVKIQDLRTLNTKTIGEAISNTPTADVVKVKSGRWEEYDDYIICSFCEKEFNIFDNCTETFNYCPNCGARMDGKDGDSE